MPELHLIQLNRLKIQEQIINQLLAATPILNTIHYYFETKTINYGLNNLDQFQRITHMYIY